MLSRFKINNQIDLKILREPSDDKEFPGNSLILVTLFLLQKAKNN
jgi:hypothetical protein